MDKKFSDFQENSCDERQTITFKKKVNPCPPCTPNPDYFLEKNWFEMEEPWLDQSTCRYNIRIRKSDLERDLSQRGDFNGTPTDQQKIRFGIRALLAHHNRLIADETVCGIGGCMTSIDDIKEFRESIREYQTALGQYEATESTQELSVAGAAGAGLLAAFGVGGGWAVFGTAALAGILIDSLHAARMMTARNENFSESELEDLGLFLRSYLGTDLSYRLDKLSALYPQIHPFALEWHAKLEAQHMTEAGLVYYKISVPALDFHRIPENPITDTTEETATNAIQLNDIIIDGPDFIEDMIKLKFALQAYEFYYTAFQHVEKIQIVQQEDITKRLSYNAAIMTLGSFKNTLNRVLRKNGYQSLNSLADFFTGKPFANKIKFRFNTEDDRPFNLAKNENGQFEVYVLGGDCPDFVLLEGTQELNNPRYIEAYGFLSRIDDIMSDLTAENTRPWLEFTLEYFYPKYVVDYGLNSGEADEEQQNALLCFLEKQLGFGDGAFINSLSQSILSAFDIMRDDFVKKSCKKEDEVSEHTWWFKKSEEQKEEEERRKDAERRAEMISRLEEREYKKLINEEIRKIEQTQEWLATPEAASGQRPTESTVESFTGVSLGVYRERANIAANKAYDDPQSWADNKPWVHDANMAAMETIEKDLLLINEVKKYFDPAPSKDDLLDLVISIGICGNSKLVDKAIKCLTSGLTIEDILEIMVEKLFSSMNLRFVPRFLNGLPLQIRDDLNDILLQEFGVEDIVQLLMAKVESGNLTVGDVMGGDNNKVKQIYDKFLNTPAPDIEEWDQVSFASELVGVSRAEWHSDLTTLLINVDRDTETGVIVVLPKEDPGYKEQRKQLKILKRKIRRLLTKSEMRFIEGAKNRYNNVKDSINEGIQNFKTTQEEREQMRQLVKEMTWHFGSDSNGDFVYLKSGPSEEWTNKEYYNSPSYVQPMAEVRILEDNGGWVYEQDIDSSITFIEVPSGNLLNTTLTADDPRVQPIIAKFGMHPGPPPLPERTREFYEEQNKMIEKQGSFLNIMVSTSDFLITAGEAEADPVLINQRLSRTTVGIKIDKLISHILLTTYEFIETELGIDEFLKRIKDHPVTGFIWDIGEKIIQDCPTQPLFHPPVKDFLRSYSVDYLCDTTESPTFPKCVVPSINPRYVIKESFLKAFQEALEKILTDLLTKLFLKVLNMLEGALCKALGIAGSLVVDALQGNLGNNSWLNALDQAFCGTGDEDKTRDLANNLLGISGDPSQINPELKDQASLVVDIMGRVGTTEQFLGNLINAAEDQDTRFNTVLAEAITYVSPNFAQLLGDPAQVAAFFENVGSYLPLQEKQSIQDLLDAGLPSMPVSDSICLTNEQLADWNESRIRNLINNGFSPAEAENQINQLNSSALNALGDLMDLARQLQSPGGLAAGELGRLTDASQNPSNPAPRSVPADPADPGGLDSVLGPPREEDPSCADRPINPFANYMAPETIEIMNSVQDMQYELIEDLLVDDTLDKKGVLGQALADTNGLNFRKHSRRTKWRYLYPDYANTEDEFDEKKDSKDPLLKLLMGNSAMAVFPETVSKHLKDRLTTHLEDINLSNIYTRDSSPEVEEFNAPGLSPNIEWLPKTNDLPLGNMQMIYEEGDLKESTYYRFQLNNVFRGKSFRHLDYKIGIWDEFSVKKDETTGQVQVYSKDYEMKFNEDELEWYLKNDIYIPNETENLDVSLDYREYAFTEYFKKRQSNAFLNNTLLTEDVLTETYELISNQVFKGVVEEILTDPDDENGGDPLGFVFGYQSDVLPEDAFEYEVSPDANETKTLGSYPNSNGRVVPLSPDTYPGLGISYLNPPFTILPIQHTGWVDIASAILPGAEGCDPKTPSVLKLDDIRERVKTLSKDLPLDPRLSKDADCVDEIPFNIIMDKTAKAALDGTVRTTIRLYATEYFLRAMGPLSNLQFNSENYDHHLSDYILEEMKRTMLESGSRSGARRIRIKRQNYWYTFLEQSVEAYQRMIDMDKITPPDYLAQHLENIQKCRDNYIYPTRKLRLEFFNNPPHRLFNLPGRELTVDDLGNTNFMNWAIAYRLYEERMFSSSSEIDMNFKYLVRLKKIRFFSKILAIRTVEESAKAILAELIRSELRTVVKKFDQKTMFSPKIEDLKRYFLGMDKIFNNTSLRIGLKSYYNDKANSDFVDTGDVDNVNSDVSTFKYDHGDQDFLLVLEKYIKLEDKAMDDLPIPSGELTEEEQTLIMREFTERDPNLKGVISMDQVPDVMATIQAEYAQGKHLSDFFGNLKFTYKVNIKDVFDNLLNISTSRGNMALINKLVAINPEEATKIRTAFQSYGLNQDYEFFEVFVSEEFYDVSNLEPSGVTGTTGVSYGLRACITPNPESDLYEMLNTRLLELIDAAREAADDAEEEFNLNDFINNSVSNTNKAFIFNVGDEDNPEFQYLIPIISKELEVKDSLLSTFDPYSGPDSYDMECMVDLMVSDAQYSILFDKIFPLKVISSMTSVFCCYGFPYSLGQYEGEREEDYDEDADWDRTFYKKSRNFLRREFQGHYLSRYLENEVDDRTDDERRDRFKLRNPFADIHFSTNWLKGLNWFQRRRLVSAPYDANGNECADPVKDLF